MSKNIELKVSFQDNGEHTEIFIDSTLVGTLTTKVNWDHTTNAEIFIESGNYSKRVASFNSIEGNYRKYLTNYMDSLINVLDVENIAHLSGDIDSKLKEIADYCISAKEKMLSYQKKYYHIQRLFDIDKKHIYDVRPV